MEADIKEKMDMIIDYALNGRLLGSARITSESSIPSLRLTFRKNLSNNPSYVVIDVIDYIHYVLSKDMSIHDTSIVLSALMFISNSSLRDLIKLTLDDFEHKKILESNIFIKDRDFDSTLGF